MSDALLRKVRSITNDEVGATAVEYGVMIALISAVIIGTVIILGTRIQAAFQAIVSGLG